MELSSYVESLRQQVMLAMETSDEEAQARMARVLASLESATRLMLLGALSDAADEITGEIAPGLVELRLRGGEPEFVVTMPPGEEEFPATGPVDGLDDEEDGAVARLNLRLPEGLKARIERAASTEGLSLNSWLVRAASSALKYGGNKPGQGPVGGDRFTGWVR